MVLLETSRTKNSAPLLTHEQYCLKLEGEKFGRMSEDERERVLFPIHPGCIAIGNLSCKVM